MAKIKKILFPTDFSKNSNHSLAHAVRLADSDDAEIIVQHVVSEYFGPHSHWSSLFDVHELQKELDFHIETEMSRALPFEKNGIRIRRVISKGKPAEEIVSLAEREYPDVIVMGPAKGAVTAKVMHWTTRPVFAVPRQHHEDTPATAIRRVLVATDFSEHSRKLVEYAFDLMDSFGCEVYMLSVIETVGAAGWSVGHSRYQGILRKMEDWARNQLFNLTPDRDARDPRVHRLVQFGSPSDHIASTAQEIGADLIVIGVHEHGKAYQSLIGTTTDKVLRKAETPILALRQ